MVTFLDFSILSGAKAIFAFILVFALVYGLLKFTKFLNLPDNFISLVAVSLAVLSVLSPQMVRVIEVVTPWYVLMMLIIIFILVTSMIFGSLGGNVGDIRKNMGGYYKIIMIWIVVISVIIFFSGLGYVFLSGSDSEYALNQDGDTTVLDGADSDATEGSDSDLGGKGVDTFLETLFHPKVVGMVLFLIIAGLTVLLMGFGN